MAKSPKYKGKVLFLEHDADASPSPRKTRFAAARTRTGSLLLPLIVVDSGYGVSEAAAKWLPGCTDNFCDYPKMVDQSLEHPPLVEIEASYHPVDVTRNLRVYGSIRNVSQETIGYDNGGTLWLMAFEHIVPPIIHVDRFVRAAVRVDLDEDLTPGSTMAFDQVMQDVPRGTNMSKVEVVVLLDYRPQVDKGPYVSAQAQLAVYRKPVLPATNDTLATRKRIEGLPYSDSVTTADATDDEGEAVPTCGNGAEKGIWYEYVPSGDEKIVLDTVDSSFDTILSVWTAAVGSDPQHPLTELACSNDDAGQQSRLVLDLAKDAHYFVKIGGVGGASGDANLNVKLFVAEPTPTPVPDRYDVFLPMAKNRAE